MAVVSQVCTLSISNGLGSYLLWRATAASQDTAAGSSTVITLYYEFAGSAIAAADTLTLDIYIDNGSTLVRSVTWNAASIFAGNFATVTFYMTNDGTSGGAARCGTLRMRLHAVNTTNALSTNRYNVDSDLTNNTPPTGSTVTIHDQGWIRGTTTSTTSLPSSGLRAYSDSLTATTTLGAAPFDSRTVKVALGSVIAATTSAASTTVTFTTTLGTVDNRFPASAVNNTTATTFPNATLTGSPWTTATLTEDTRSIDPRLTFTHLLQIDLNTYGTPPSVNNVASKQRLTSELGFLCARVTNASGTGINSITWTTTLQDAGSLVTALTNTPTSATKGGQAGWGDSFLSWASALPGGTWNKTCVITAPAGAVGLEAGATDAYTLIASNPNLRLVCGGGPASLGDDVKHWSPGMPFEVGLVVFNTSTLTTVALDASPTAFLGRLSYSTGKVEYLDSDGITWVAATGATAYAHPLTASPTDANVYLTSFTAVQTADWGTADVFVIGRCTVGGVPVNDFSKEITVSTKNRHDAYAFDGAGFVGFPTR